MGLLPMGADILPPSDDRVFKLILTSPEARQGLMSISQDQVERAKFRSRRKFQTDMQSDLATSWDNGRAEGRAEGRVETMAASIRSLMDSLGWSMEQAMSALGLSEEERSKYRELLNG